MLQSVWVGSYVRSNICTKSAEVHLWQLSQVQSEEKLSVEGAPSVLEE